jgi:prevent-host-death family protein
MPRLHRPSTMTIMTIMTTSTRTTARAGNGAQAWTVAEAKAKFSEIIERAKSEGPQTVTKSGRVAAIVVGAEEWERKTQRVGNLAEFFAASPLRGSGLKVTRLGGKPRKISL